MSGQSHAYLDRNARIGDIGCCPVTDRVRSSCGDAYCAKHPLPRPMIRSVEDRAARFVRSRYDEPRTIRTVLSQLQKHGSLIRNWLPHRSSLAVRPSDLSGLDIHPTPFKIENFGGTRSESQLQPDRKRICVDFATLGARQFQIFNQPYHLWLCDEGRRLLADRHRDPLTRVSILGSISPLHGPSKHSAQKIHGYEGHRWRGR